MKFPAKNLLLISIHTITKNDKTFTFVKLADRETYENVDFMLGNETKADDLKNGTDYRAVLEVEGRFSSINLLPLAE